MKDKKFIQAHAKTSVPGIDEIRFHLVVTNNIEQSHREFKLGFAPGNCCHDGAESHMEQFSQDCFVFLGRKYVTHGMIGHELHHSLNQISTAIGHKVSSKNDELTARIAEFLNAWVYKQLESADIVVTHRPTKI